MKVASDRSTMSSLPPSVSMASSMNRVAMGSLLSPVNANFMEDF